MSANQTDEKWRGNPRLRAALSHSLPIECPYCHAMIYGYQDWDVDHVLPRKYGGTISNGVRPAHRLCNIKAGHAVKRAANRTVTHSRDW